MGLMDKAKEMLGKHPDQAKQGIDKAGDMIDERTGGQHADKVDKVQDKAREYLDRDQNPQQ
ncbi:antitoxin [Lentzea sp. NPDC051213]|uniref:antitoxin n=1 Tax=Lentzea sp. NPDC051213 TaxID=3364126 RepID=UPI0037A64E4C